MLVGVGAVTIVLGAITGSPVVVSAGLSAFGVGVGMVVTTVYPQLFVVAKTGADAAVDMSQSKQLSIGVTIVGVIIIVAGLFQDSFSVATAILGAIVAVAGGAMSFFYFAPKVRRPHSSADCAALRCPSAPTLRTPPSNRASKELPKVSRRWRQSAAPSLPGR